MYEPASGSPARPYPESATPDFLSFDIRDLGVATALFLNQQATVSEIQATASNLLGFNLTVADITGANPNPLANYDLNGDGQMGQLSDLGVALALYLGATTPMQIEQICQESLAISCEIQPGATIPTLGSMNPGTPIVEASPTPDPTDELDELFPDLPPDPGEEGMQTLEGIDADGDGVRDDVQRFIFRTYPDDERRREAMLRFARALQDNIVNAERDSRDQVRQRVIETFRAIKCAYVAFDSGFDLMRGGPEAEATIDEVSEARRAVEFVILNTQERVIADLIADQKFSGQVVNGSETTCR